MKEKNIKVYKLIDECISIIDGEISLHLQNKSADGDIDTLNEIKIELQKMKDAMSPKIYYPTYDYILRDSLWDYMKISEKLLDAYYSYIKL